MRRAKARRRMKLQTPSPINRLGEQIISLYLVTWLYFALTLVVSLALVYFASPC